MTNQASEDEQIDDVLTNAIDYYISGNGVQPEAISRVKSLIRTEKLKLLDKFENDCKYNYTTFGNSEKMLQVSGLLKRIEAERTKLEAEL